MRYQHCTYICSIQKHKDMQILEVNEPKVQVIDNEIIIISWIIKDENINGITQQTKRFIELTRTELSNVKSSVKWGGFNNGIMVMSKDRTKGTTINWEVL